RMVDPAEIESVYQSVLHSVARLVGQPDVRVVVAFVDGDQLTTSPEHAYNYEPNARRGTWSWPIGRSPTSRAVIERRSVLVPDVRKSEVYFIGWTEGDDTICELAVPLIRGEEALGVIDVNSPREGVLTERHQRMIEALAEQVVQALDRAEQIR